MSKRKPTVAELCEKLRVIPDLSSKKGKRIRLKIVRNDLNRCKNDVPSLAWSNKIALALEFAAKAIRPKRPKRARQDNCHE